MVWLTISPMRWTMPEVTKARVTASTTATTTTAGWPKPSKASVIGTTPATTQATSAITATTS